MFGAAVILASAVHTATAARESSIEVYQTARDTGDRLTRKDPIPFGPDFSSPVTVTIDPRVAYQPIHGFGGAITEAATSTIAKLPSVLQQRVIDSYYTDGGLGYNTGRVAINSCDFSINSYSFDDTADDFQLKNFDHSLTRDQATIIPFIRRVIAATDKAGVKLDLFATPWSPPAWMKGNGAMTGSSSPCLKNGDNYKQAWASYYVEWFRSYAANNISFWGLTVQNEAEYAANWEACTYTPEEQRDFIKGWLGPTLRAGFPNLKLMIFDHNRDHMQHWADVIYTDREAAQYIWGMAFHWYADGYYDQISAVHDKYPNFHLLPTEGCECPGVRLGDWSRGEHYGMDILNDLNNWAEGWTDWNIVLNPQGGPNHLNNFCDAPIIADTDKGEVHYQPSYFYIGHFSKFLPRGSQRISSFVTGGDALEVTSFMTPKQNTTVIILLNRKDNAVTTKIQVRGNTTAAKVNVPAHSILTLSFHL